jgi:hypothetical protein
MSQNLSLEEIAKWKETCKRQRDIARTNPCYDPRMVLLEDFSVRLGPWMLRLTLDTYLKPPMWHGTVALMKQLGDETVYGPDGMPIFEVPQEGIVAVESWTREDYSEARDLLGDLFGSLINHVDQRVIEGYVPSGMSLQWLTSNKDADQRIEIPRV